MLLLRERARVPGSAIITGRGDSVHNGLPRGINHSARLELHEALARLCEDLLNRRARRRNVARFAGVRGKSSAPLALTVTHPATMAPRIMIASPISGYWFDRSIVGVASGRPRSALRPVACDRRSATLDALLDVIATRNVPLPGTLALLRHPVTSSPPVVGQSLDRGRKVTRVRRQTPPQFGVDRFAGCDKIRNFPQRQGLTRPHARGNGA